MTRFTDEEVEVIREGLDMLLAKKPEHSDFHGKRDYDFVELRTRRIAEELYSRIRVELAA